MFLVQISGLQRCFHEFELLGLSRSSGLLLALLNFLQRSRFEGRLSTQYRVLLVTQTCSRLEDRLLPFGFEVKFPWICQNDLAPEGIWGLELVDEMLLGPRFGSCSRLDGRLQFPKRAADLLLLASASQSLSNMSIGNVALEAKSFCATVLESVAM